MLASSAPEEYACICSYGSLVLQSFKRRQANISSIRLFPAPPRIPRESCTSSTVHERSYSSIAPQSTLYIDRAQRKTYLRTKVPSLTRSPTIPRHPTLLALRCGVSSKSRLDMASQENLELAWVMIFARAVRRPLHPLQPKPLVHLH